MKSVNPIAQSLTVALCVTGCALSALSALSANAADYPTKAIQIIVPLPPGGPSDLIARLYADHLQKEMKVNAVVENRPGAGTIVGAVAAKNAPPDGHTLLMTSIGLVTSVFMVKDLPYDPIKDFTPVSRVSEAIAFLLVNSAVPANNLTELVRYLKANPGKLSFGYAGSGLLWSMRFLKETGIAPASIVSVPYPGGAKMGPALASGEVQFTFDHCTGACKASLATGKIKMLGAGSEQRDPEFSSVPTFQESGFKDFTTVAWQGIVAPAGTPPDIVDRLAASVKSMLRQPDTQKRLEGLGLVAVGSTAAEFRRRLQDDLVRWKEVADFGGLKPQ